MGPDEPRTARTSSSQARMTPDERRMVPKLYKRNGILRMRTGHGQPWTTPGRLPDYPDDSIPVRVPDNPDESRMAHPGVSPGREPDVLNILIHPGLSPDWPRINLDHPDHRGRTKDESCITQDGPWITPDQVRGSSGASIRGNVT